MEKQKENAIPDFIKMIRQSWTFARMTDEEAQKCLDLFREYPAREALVGSYDHRWNVCHAIYDAYLIGIGYTTFNWREPEGECVPSF